MTAMTATAMGQAQSPLQSGLNPRLTVVRDVLAECEKMLYEARQSLGIPEPPSGGDKKSEQGGSTSASLTMDLIASSGRIHAMLSGLLSEVRG